MTSVSPLSIAINRDLLEAEGEPITLVFKVSETQPFQIKCPKEYLATASEYFFKIFRNRENQFLETSKSQIEIDLSNTGTNFANKHFELLSNYINFGVLKPFDEKAEWALEEAKALYELSDSIQMPEVMKFAEDVIAGHIKAARNRYDGTSIWRECLCFGIRYRSSAIVGPAFEDLSNDYTSEIKYPTSKQYLHNALSLIKKSVFIIKKPNEAKREVQEAEKLFTEYLNKQTKTNKPVKFDSVVESD